MKHAVRRIFVEGGGDKNQSLQIECRRAFSTLLRKAGFEGRMPRIVACGGRSRAYEQFRTAVEGLEEADLAVLLVDSESAVTTDSPWDHVKDRAGDLWVRPDGVSDDHLHFMVQCMEAWFLADRTSMRAFFGNGFRENGLPSADTGIETMAKRTLYEKLEAATKETKTKGAYKKSEHSFKLLAQLDPGLIRKASPWAERFFSMLDRLLS